MASTVQTIDEYSSAYNGELKERMITLRALIHSCHPDITEKIAWGIPTFVLKGNLVHFSAEKKHMGFHPGKEAIDAFADRFGKLTHTKSTLHLPYNQPMPWDLLREMVSYCVRQRMQKDRTRGSGGPLPLVFVERLPPAMRVSRKKFYLCPENKPPDDRE